MSNRITDELFIGTYTDKNSEGIYAVPIADIGTASVSLSATIENPSYLALSPLGDVLYAVSESSPGAVSAYRVSGTTCSLLNRVSTGGAGLVHLVLDGSGRFLFTASYEDATVQMFSVELDGRIGALRCEASHEGRGANPVRQEKAHAHSVCLTPSGRELCVCDLGIDMLAVYAVDYGKTTITREVSRSVAFPSGSGPRHMVFHPAGQFAYVLAELSSQIYAFVWSDAKGFQFIQSVDLLATPDPESTSAAIRITGDGRFIYASNRGQDVIVVYAVQENGLLREVQSITCGGKHPRDFILSTDERSLFCANRDTDNITWFDRDPVSGILSPCIVIPGVPSPIALLVSSGKTDLSK